MIISSSCSIEQCLLKDLLKLASANVPLVVGTKLNFALFVGTMLTKKRNVSKLPLVEAIC